MAHPEVIARQLDRCDRCGKVLHKKDLSLTQVEFAKKNTTNYLPYSSYNSTFWSCGSTDAGAISIGSHEGARCKVALDNTVTEVGGSQTWHGTGTIRTTTAVDVSAWTSLAFQVIVGPYHRSTNTEMAIAAGMCSSSGTGKIPLLTKTINASSKIWFGLLVADIDPSLSAAATYYYITTTCSGSTDYDDYWWMDDAALNKDSLVPLTFVQTTGSSYAQSTMKRGMAMEKVCRDCFRKVWPKSKEKGIPGERPEILIGTVQQEL